MSVERVVLIFCRSMDKDNAPGEPEVRVLNIRIAVMTCVGALSASDGNGTCLKCHLMSF